MSNAALQIIQTTRGAIGANKTSTFIVRLLNPDDYTDLRDIPGLAAGEWFRADEESAVDLAEEIGQTLTTNHIPYTVEWP